MAEAYNTPELCNSYCARECPLGRNSVSEVDIVDFDRLALKVRIPDCHFRGRCDLRR